MVVGWVMKRYICIIVLLLAALNLFSSDDVNMDVNKSNSVKIIDKFGDTALHDTIRSGDIKIVEYLIFQGADVNATGQYNYTPLHLAVRANDLNISKLLLINRSIVNSKDDFGDTPLIDAVKNNNEELTKLLLCKGAKKDEMNNSNLTALDYASINKNPNITMMLTQEDLNLFCSGKKETQLTEENKKLLDEMKELEEKSK